MTEATLDSLDVQKAHQLLQRMILIRRFEEACAEHYSAGSIRGFLHLYIGEEAVATGIMDCLQPDDAVVATYREHAHAILKGLDPGEVMAEMFGKVEGSSRGRGGSMHIFSARHRLFGGNAIVGGGLPLACGLALADRMQDRPRVTVCFFGEGACCEGEFHESMNLAELWKLPVLFVCENNLYAMGTHIQRSESEVDLLRKCDSYKVPGTRVDGMDVAAVRAAAGEIVGRMRDPDYGPHFLECQTYRFRAHSMFDAELYRDKAEVEAWKKKGPIRRFAAALQEAGRLSDEEMNAMQAKADKQVQAAVDFAAAGTLEPVEELTRHVLWEGEAL
jgi:pyruvate dehydrogenase E1 component alpha subunit